MHRNHARDASTRGPTVADLQKMIVFAAEQRSKSGRGPQRTLELALRACADDGFGALGYHGFCQAVRSVAPGMDDAKLRALFDHHAVVRLDAVAGPYAGEVNCTAFAKALFEPAAEAVVAAPTRAAAPARPFAHPYDARQPPDPNRHQPREAWGTAYGGGAPSAAPARGLADVAAAAARAPLAAAAPLAAGRAAPGRGGYDTYDALENEPPLDAQNSAPPPAPLPPPGRQLGKQRPASAAAKAAEAEAEAEEAAVLLAVKQLNHCLGVEARVRPVLPPSERVTMNLSQQQCASRQIVLLRALRSVEPVAARLTEGQLSAALQPLAQHQLAGGGGAGGGGGGGGASARQPPSQPRRSQQEQQRTPQTSFLRAAPLRAIWRRGGGGDVQALIELLCPHTPADAHYIGQSERPHERHMGDRMPAGMGRPGAAPPPPPPPPPADEVFGGGGYGGQGRAARGVAARPTAVRPAGGTLQPATAGGAVAGLAGGDARDAAVVADGPFDRGSGRKGVRHVAAPPRSALPDLIKYRFSTTPVQLPSGFEPHLVTRSATLPDTMLRREFAYGYNGLGKHNRAPNLCVLADGRLLYCTAALAIVYDPRSAAQSYFEAHDDDISCVALHPGGQLAVTGQVASAVANTHPWLAVWDVNTRKQVCGRIGEVFDETKKDGVSTRPFYQRSLCAAAFSPDGTLLFAIGTDDQHTLGVWRWGKKTSDGRSVPELLISAPTLKEHPLGIHQLAVAPQPLADGSLMLVTVGVSAAPKFWTFGKPAEAPRGAAAFASRLRPREPRSPWSLTFKLGRTGGENQPKSLSAVAFGGDAFSSPSGVPWGVTLIGGGGGRIFLFDAPTAVAAHRVILAHDSAVTSLLATPSGVVSGGADGAVHLWRRQQNSREVERVHTYSFGVDASAEAAAQLPSSGAPAASGPGGPGGNAVDRLRNAGGVAALLGGWGGDGGSGGAPATARAGGGGGRLAAAARQAAPPKQSNRVADALKAAQGGKVAAAAAVAASAEEAAAAIGAGRGAGAARGGGGGGGGAAAKKRAGPSAVSANAALPAAMLGTAGAIRAIALVAPAPSSSPSGGAPTAASVPTLVVGTARCSIWRLGGGGATELLGAHFGDVTGVAPHPSRADVWATCGADRQLLLWRAADTVPLQACRLPAAARCVDYSSDAQLIAAGLDDGSLALLRPAPVPAADEPAPVGGGAGGGALGSATMRSSVATAVRNNQRPIEDVKFAPRAGLRGGMLACAGHDRVIDIYEIVVDWSSGELRLSLALRSRCKGHTATVTHLDWAADGRLLMSNCAAKEQLCWAMPSAKRQPQAKQLLADTAWHTWTCVLGFPVLGIWPDSSDGSDVNAAHRSADGSLMLTADDFGLLKLFHAPCVVEDAPARVATGHCSHLACARFLASDAGAISGGGADRTVMRWRLVAAPPLDRFAPAAPLDAATRAAWRPQGRGNAARPWWGTDQQSMQMY